MVRRRRLAAPLLLPLRLLLLLPVMPLSLPLQGGVFR